jgi:hypothetical protein
VRNHRLITHHWSWEEEGWRVNSRVWNVLEVCCGMENDKERFYRTVAGAEVTVTDLLDIPGQLLSTPKTCLLEIVGVRHK